MTRENIVIEEPKEKEIVSQLDEKTRLEPVAKDSLKEKSDTSPKTPKKKGAAPDFFESAGFGLSS